MRVCTFSRVVEQHGIHGGMEKHLKIVGTGLRAAGHEHVVLTTRHPSDVLVQETEWGTIHFLPGTRPGAYWPGLLDQSWEHFRQLHAADPFDVVVSEGAAAEEYARHSRRFSLPPLVSIMHGTLWGEVANYFHSVSNVDNLRRVLRYMPPMLHHALFWQSYVRQAELLIAVSPEVQKRVRREYQIPEKKIHLIPNGVETSLFAPNPVTRRQIRQTLQIDDTTHVLGVMGRLSPEKGTTLAVETIAQLRAQGQPVKLLVVGDGPERALLQHMVDQKRLDEDVHFTGRVSHEVVPDYLNAFDLVLLPTMRNEGFPFALVEAMSCAKPVIVSRFPGVEYIIQNNENGMHVPKGDVQAITLAVQKLLSDPARGQRMGLAARDTVLQKFDLTSMINKTVDTLIKLANSSNHHSSTLFTE